MRIRNRAVRATYVKHIDPLTSPKQIDFALEGSLFPHATVAYRILENGNLVPVGDKPNAAVLDARLYSPLATPNISWPDNSTVVSGQHAAIDDFQLLGIYRLTADKLTYCVAGFGKERPTEFAVTKSSSHTLISLERFSTGEQQIETELTKAGARVTKDEIGWITDVQLKDCDDDLAEKIAGLSRLKNLRQYHYGSNKGRELGKWTAEGLRAISKLERLESLHAMYPMDDACVAELAKLRNLQSLRINAPNLTDEGLRSLSSLTQLTSLRLQKSEHITDAGLRHLATLPHLSRLSITGYKNITDEGLAALAEQKQLSSLSLSDTENVSVSGLEVLATLPDLKTLSLAGSPVNDGWLKTIARNSKLSRLYIPQTRITDEGLAHLATMSSLTHLSLSDTAITAAGIQKLTATQSLQMLDISKTNISDDSLQLIAASFPDLNELHFADCVSLGDEGLVGLAQLEKLNYITVTRGQFSSNALSKLRLCRWTPGDGEEISIVER